MALRSWTPFYGISPLLVWGGSHGHGLACVDVVQDTYGLGAGLGSNRAFGTLAYIGSNLGFFGLASSSTCSLSCWANVLTTSVCATSSGQPGRVAIIACAAAFCAISLACGISGAEISDPRIWVLWGMLLASSCLQNDSLPRVSSAAFQGRILQMFYTRVLALANSASGLLSSFLILVAHSRPPTWGIVQ